LLGSFHEIHALIDTIGHPHGFSRFRVTDDEKELVIWAKKNLETVEHKGWAFVIVPRAVDPIGWELWDG
jgi:hypothetical protein